MPHKEVFVFFLIIGSLTLPALALGSGVVINEVLFNPLGNDTGSEWVELYNGGEVSENLNGWQLYPDGAGYFNFPSDFKLDSKKYVVVHLHVSGSDSSTDLYNPSTSKTNMGNTSGSVALFSGDPHSKDTVTIKSFVEWGASKTWESDAEKAGLWTKGTFVDIINLNEGSSIALLTDGVGGSKDNWKISSSTPGISNSGQSSPSNPPVGGANTNQNTEQPVESNQSNFVTPVIAFLVPKIKAYAGEDGISSVGSSVKFSGSALGLKDEPLNIARFWWNFGDGETAEGRVVEHIFKIPGKYITGLNVSAGEYAASDYVIEQIEPNQIAIKSVLLGEEGYISLANPSKIEVDIGNWIIEDGSGKKFSIPPMTKIGPGADVSLANETTGILKLNPAFPVTLRYLNSEIAYRLEKSDSSLGNTGKSSEIIQTQTALKKAENTSAIFSAKYQNETLSADFGAVNNQIKTATSSLSSLGGNQAKNIAKTSGVFFWGLTNSKIFMGLAILLGLGLAAGSFFIGK